mgnify:FL=1|jgi:hypothetical protein
MYGLSAQLHRNRTQQNVCVSYAALPTPVPRGARGIWTMGDPRAVERARALSPLAKIVKLCTYVKHQFIVGC